MFYLKCFVLIMVCLFAQATIFSNLYLLGVIPNLVLIAVILIGIFNGRKRGFIIGIMAGLLIDLSIGRNLGLSVVIYGAIGLLSGYLTEKYHLDSFTGVLMSVLAGSLIAGFLKIFGMNILGSHYSYLGSMLGIVLPETLYNLVILLIILPITRFIMRGKYFSRFVRYIQTKDFDWVHK